MEATSTTSWRSRLRRQRPSDVVWKNTRNRSKRTHRQPANRSTSAQEDDHVLSTNQQWVAVKGWTSSSDVDGHMGADRVDRLPCGSLRDHDEDLTGADAPTTLEDSSCVQVSERETTLLDERTGKILQSVAGLRISRQVLTRREGCSETGNNTVALCGVTGV